MVVDPTPYGSLLGVKFGSDKFGHNAVSRAEYILADGTFERQLLAALLALDEEAEFLRQGSQRLDHITRRIAARTTRAARHALAAKPYRIAAQQLLDLVVVTRLHYVDNLTGIVVVELGRRAYSRADAAVHARFQTFAQADVLHQHIEIFSHKSTDNFATTKLPVVNYKNIGINT